MKRGTSEDSCWVIGSRKETPLLGGWAPRTDGYVVNWPMVNNKSPKDRVVGPLPNVRNLRLINGGDPNHLLTGMILKVRDNDG